MRDKYFRPKEEIELLWDDWYAEKKRFEDMLEDLTPSQLDDDDIIEFLVNCGYEDYYDAWEEYVRDFD